MKLIVNKPMGTAQQATDFILRHPHSPEYTAWDIEKKIVWPYFYYSPGVDPVMLIAQMIHETGNLTSWWSQRPRRNPAGIGVTGAVYTPQVAGGPHFFAKAALKDGVWHQGNSYHDWTDAVWCHIGRVLCYRFTSVGGDEKQRRLMDLANADRTFPPKHRGKYQNWEDLNGVWAVPGTHYAQSIINIAEAICEVD